MINRTRPSLVRALALGSLLTAAALTWAQHDAPAGSGHHPDTAPLAEAHATLADRAGSYTTTTRVWGSPGDDPIVSKGTATLELASDGRFLLERSRGELLGHPTETLRLYGYNSGTRRHEAMWAYTHSSAMIRMTGEADEATGTITYTGSWDESATERVTVWARLRTVDRDRFVLTMYGSDPAESAAPVMEVTYRRAAAG